MAAPQIERRSGLSRAEFQARYLGPRIPVILTDAVKHWRALETWTPELLRARCGSRKVPCHHTVFDFAQVIDEVCDPAPNPDRVYLSNVDIPRNFPELMPDIEPPIEVSFSNRLHSRLMPRDIPTSNHETLLTLFVGGAGGFFPLHYDFFNVATFVTQIYGTKHFTFFSPDQSRWLYPSAEDPKHSEIRDIAQVDLDRYPLFRNTEPTTLTLQPGETLLVPPGWWHTTRLDVPSIGIGESFVDAHNWFDFMIDAFDGRRSSSLTRAALVAGYLGVAGAVLAVKERVLPPRSHRRLG